MNLMKFPEMHMDGSCIGLSDRPIAVEYGDISTRCIGLSSFFRFHRFDDVRAGIQVRAVQYFWPPPPRRGAALQSVAVHRSGGSFSMKRDVGHQSPFHNWVGMTDDAYDADDAFFLPVPYAP